MDDEDGFKDSASPDLSTLNQVNQGTHRQPSRFSQPFGEQNDRSDEGGTIPMRDSCSPPPQEDYQNLQDDEPQQHIEAVVVKEESAGNNSTINLKLTKVSD